MKNILLVLLAIFVLVGCGSTQPEVQAQPEETVSPPLPSVVDLAALPDVIDVRTTADIQNREDVVMIDVREKWEYDEAHIPGIILIPMSEFESRIDEIPTDKTVILACQSGVRSSRVQTYLTQLGYENVHDMAGGTAAWQAAGFPVE